MSTDLSAESFTRWFLANYPSRVILTRPEWHAPKIYRAAMQDAEQRIAELERERDLLAETARRVTAERDRLASALDEQHAATDRLWNVLDEIRGERDAAVADAHAHWTELDDLGLALREPLTLNGARLARQDLSQYVNAVHKARVVAVHVAAAPDGQESAGERGCTCNPMRASYCAWCRERDAAAAPARTGEVGRDE